MINYACVYEASTLPDTLVNTAKGDNSGYSSLWLRIQKQCYISQTNMKNDQKYDKKPTSDMSSLNFYEEPNL